MNSIDGVITRISYHQVHKSNPAGVPFLIARLSNGTTVKGEMRKPIEGERYRFWGEMKEQRGNFPPAFEFVSHEPLCDRSTSGCEQYLAAHIDGIGHRKAAAIAERFGADTLDVLRADPNRVLEVPGITPAIVASIVEHFQDARLDPVAFAKCVDLFRRGDHRVPKSTIKAIVGDWGSDAPSMIVEQPYMLLRYPRIGFKTADSFAITTAGYDPQGIDRQKAAIVEAIEQIALQGHTWATQLETANAAFKLILSVPTERAWQELIADAEIVPVPNGYTTPDLDYAESTIADQVRVLQDSARPFPCEISTDGLVGDQVTAVETIQSNGVSLLIGPPGCGKSYTVARVIKSLIGSGFTSISVVAPTGKAAKRAVELLTNQGITEIECTTIHRALAPEPNLGSEGVPASSAKHGRGREEFTFAKNEGNPIESAFVVIDESSMVDVKLGAALLRAIAPGTRVLFVGDQNQLPSVGPGSMLRDLVASEIPTAELTEIKRSDGGGRVVRACHAIRAGREPEPASHLEMPTENWVHIEEPDPNAIAQRIVDIHRFADRYDPWWEMQVVSAQRGRLPFACDSINRQLSALLNPIQRTGDDDQGGPPFAVGDKVIRRKNGVVDSLVPTTADRPEDADWEWAGELWDIGTAAIVNGDMGTVRDVAVDGDKAYVLVLFRDPERFVRIPLSDHNLQLAYAITVHSAQGSGFPVVIVPVHNAFYFDDRTGQGLWCRELIYTALSRTEQILITVGQWQAIQTAVKRPTVHRRKTRLENLIRNASEASMEVAK